MRETLDLLRHERRARVFFAALAQSTIGTGAGYVALLLIAYDRLQSPWAISLVLIAELLPAMLLGPLFGAFADRWSRKWCMVFGDASRAVAFVGVLAVDSFSATVLFAGVAGVGTAVFTPAALAALPSVVDDKRRTPAATSLYGAVGDFGFTGGFALSATLLLILGGPVGVLAVNAVTFAISALVLGRLVFGSMPLRPDGERPSLVGETVEGLRTVARTRDIRVVMLGSTGGLICAGIFNIAELPFVTEDLGASEAGFSLLLMFFGIGFVGGSLAGSKGGVPSTLKRGYLAGLPVIGLGLLATGAATSFAVVALTFTVAGLGNGLLLVYERLLIQASIPDRLVGRVFGARDALTAWAFGIAFVAGGGLVSGLGPRDPILIAGGVAVVVYAITAIALRHEWPVGAPARGGRHAAAEGGPPPAALDGGAEAMGGDSILREDGADVVRGGEHLDVGTLEDLD